MAADLGQGDDLEPLWGGAGGHRRRGVQAAYVVDLKDVFVTD